MLVQSWHPLARPSPDLTNWPSPRSPHQRPAGPAHQNQSPYPGQPGQPQTHAPLIRFVGFQKTLQRINRLGLGYFLKCIFSSLLRPQQLGVPVAGWHSDIHNASSVYDTAGLDWTYHDISTFQTYHLLLLGAPFTLFTMHGLMTSASTRICRRVVQHDATYEKLI